MACKSIGGLHCRHVGGQNKTKTSHIVSIKMEFNSPKEKNLFVPIHQHDRHDVTCNPPINGRSVNH